MTVKELIEELQKYSLDLKVVVKSECACCDDYTVSMVIMDHETNEVILET